VCESLTLPTTDGACTRDTWQHTDRYRTVTVHVSQPIPKLRDGILQCESKPHARGMHTLHGARPKRVRDSEAGPTQASGIPLAAQLDDRQPDELHEHSRVRAQGSALVMPDNTRLGPGPASPQPHGATAGAQRAAAGVSPGGRPVAPPGLGRLVTVVTPHSVTLKASMRAHQAS
jgi:hypothetical protein